MTKENVEAIFIKDGKEVERLPMRAGWVQSIQEKAARGEKPVIFTTEKRKVEYDDIQVEEEL